MLDKLIPLVVFALSFIVGLELTIQDFRRVLAAPRVVVVGTLAQIVLLPVLGYLLIHSLNLMPLVAGGVLLIAVCPGGGISNYYTYLARGNVALSVTLTAISCLLAAVTMPVALGVLERSGHPLSFAQVPYVALFGQLVFLLLLPISLGMGARRYLPAFVQKHSRAFQRGSVVLLVLLIGFILYEGRRSVVSEFSNTVAASATLALVSCIVGAGIGVLLRASPQDVVTLAIEFTVRNLGLAAAIAVAVLHQVEFAVFATVYFLIQVPLLLTVAFVFRSRGRRLLESALSPATKRVPYR